MEEGHSRQREQQRHEAHCKLSFGVEGGEVLMVVGRDREGTGEPCGRVKLLTIRRLGTFKRF